MGRVHRGHFCTVHDPKNIAKREARSRAYFARLRDALRFTDAEIAEWAERHDLGRAMSGATDRRAAFEDARSLVRSPTPPEESHP